MFFQPLELGLRNFQSYGNNITKINLNFKSATLIQGKNLDSIVDGQIDSNGSGKTTILNAISYVCYDKVLDPKVKINDLINRINGKNMFLYFEFIANGLVYRIERYRKLDKKGNGVVFLCKKSREDEWNYAPKKDGGHDITNDSTSNVDAEIEKVIGIPYEIFSRIITITASNTPFLNLKLDDQRNIVEELFGYTELTQKAEKLKEKIKANNTEMNNLTLLDEQIKQELIRYNTQLTQAQTKVDEWEKSKAEKITKLQSKIKEWNDTYKAVDFEKEEEKFLSLQELEQNIVKETNTLISLKKDIGIIDLQINKIESWSKTHESDLSKLKEKIDQPLIFKTVEEANEFNTELATFDAKISEINNEVIGLNTEIAKTESALKLQKKEIAGKEATIKRLNESATKLENELKTLKESKCPYCEQHYSKSKDKITEITDKLEEIISNINIEQTALEDNHSEVLALEASLSVFNEQRSEKIKSREDQQVAKKAFVVDILGSADINLQAEFQKTANYQTLKNEYTTKVAQNNPYLADVSLEELLESKSELMKESDIISKSLETRSTGKQAIMLGLIFKQFKDIAPAKFTLTTLTTDLQKAQDEINPYTEILESLRKDVIPVRKTEEIQDLHMILEHQDFLLKLLTKKDSFIRKALLNKYLPFLNTRIKYYLDKIGLPHKVEFLENMEVKLSQFKSEIPFATFSSGQKARVNIALSFAFRDVLSSRYGIIPFVLLDEVLDVGLGATGVALTIKMLKTVCKEHDLSMFIITHRDEVSNLFTSKLSIELKNGFSNIVESDI